MSWLDVPYNRYSLRHRCKELFRIGDGPVEITLRCLVVLFIIRTCANPAEHIYIGPFMWVLIIAFIFFYM